MKTRRFHANHVPAALSKNEPDHDTATSEQGNALARNKPFGKNFSSCLFYSPSMITPLQCATRTKRKTALDTEGRFSYASALL
ncbi:MAG: hypothetical protein IJ474_04820 [Mailhella sp.]|nr:hypothetical protein [Mailhella sp.]